MADKIRVQKLLSNRGYCSRRKGEELISQGKVKVNGKIIKLGDSAFDTDEIKVGEEIIPKEDYVYLMFNKPLGCVSALTDPKYKTVIDYIKIKERVFPIGRLDYNTTGLLLLTNDGDFANKIIHPRYEIKKTYRVEIDKPIFDKKLDFLRKGVKLEDFTTHPADVKKVGPTILDITIHEGKNRIIRRMIEKLGLRVVSLHRIRIGGLGLYRLKPGEYQYLKQKDLDKIFIKD
jgi:23S rRNA pseudouridine2605 synthase